MNQNKGIGAYENRPGYFWGGMVGGAILGALVNKVQGKDWKRGALMGGIGGGLGSWAGKALMPAGAGVGGSPLLKSGWNKLPWYQKMLATAANKYGTAAAATGIGAAAGAGASYMMGDPEEERRRQEEAMLLEDEKRKQRNTDLYGDWYKNFWPGFFKNEGGMINARPGYQGGGSATLEYTDPDLYTPTGENEYGPGSGMIKSLPIGDEPSFADEFGGYDDLAMSDPDPMDEWNQMYENYLLKGGAPMPLPDFIEMMLNEGDFTPEYGARGGLMSRPGYMSGGMSGIHPETEDEGYTYDIDNRKYHFDEPLPEDEEERRRMLQKIFEANLPTAGEYIPEIGAYEKSPLALQFAEDRAMRAQGGIMGYYGGGMSDMDLTQGGASFGPGTGTSDDIPAMLSDGEFVVTANAVKNLGGGNRMLGAKKMYQMMNSLDPNSQTPAEMDTTGIA